MRRPSTGSSTVVRVPNLVGLAVPAAHDAALDAGVLAVERPTDDPAGREPGPVTVTGQHPVAGSVVVSGSRVQRGPPVPTTAPTRAGVVGWCRPVPDRFCRQV